MTSLITNHCTNVDWNKLPERLHPEAVDWKIAHGSRDIYYRRAKETGFRARSAYKLIQLDEMYGIFDGVLSVVDLCAAPGSWSQVAANRIKQNRIAKGIDVMNAKNGVMAIDLQEMSPIPGVDCLQGDITSQTTVDQILTHFDDRVDLVICDGAPDVTGVHEIDEFVHSQLMYAALNITIRMIRMKGTFVAKMFKDRAYPLLEAQLLMFFDRVDCMKPSSSRVRSAEHFVICQGFKIPDGYQLTSLNLAHDVTANDLNKQPHEKSQQCTKLIDQFAQSGDLSSYDHMQPTNVQSSGSYSTLVNTILAEK